MTRVCEVECSVGKSQLEIIGINQDSVRESDTLSPHLHHSFDEFWAAGDGSVFVPNIGKIASSFLVLSSFRQHRFQLSICSDNIPSRCRWPTLGLEQPEIFRSHRRHTEGDSLSLVRICAFRKNELTSSVLETCFVFVPLISKMSDGT